VVRWGPGIWRRSEGSELLDVGHRRRGLQGGGGGGGGGPSLGLRDPSLLVFRDQTIADDIQVPTARAFGPAELTRVASLAPAASTPA